MENNHNKTVLEQTYQAQREQQIPDLWSRIEQGFDEEVKQVKSKRRNQYTKYFVLAAAVVLAIVIAVPVFMRNSGLKKDAAFDYGTKNEYVQDNQKDMSDDADACYSNSEKEEADGACAENDAGIMLAEECDESAAMELTEAGVDSENMDDSAEDITYLFSGQRTKCNGTYDDIQCFALQEIGKDGENGRYIYVDMDSELAEVAKKLLIQYSVLDWTSSEEECVGENSYLFGFELKDGTVYTIRFLENDAFDSQTCLKFAQVMFRIKK